MTLHIFCIVEGHGEERGYPALIRNFYNFRGIYDVKVLPPYRIGKDHFIKSDSISEIVRLGCNRIIAGMVDGDDGLVLVSRDSDGLCPVELSQEIQAALTGGFAFPRIEIVICNREFEAWFLAGAQSFVGHADFRDDLTDFDNAESIQDAKGQFERSVLRDGRYYSVTVDQPKFASLLDFDLCPEKRSRSLERLIKVLDSV